MGSISNRCMENWIQSTISAFSHFDLSNLEDNIFILSSQKQWFLYIFYQKHLVCWGYVAMLLTVKLRPYSEHYPQYWSTGKGQQYILIDLAIKEKGKAPREKICWWEEKYSILHKRKFSFLVDIPIKIHLKHRYFNSCWKFIWSIDISTAVDDAQKTPAQNWKGKFSKHLEFYFWPHVDSRKRFLATLVALHLTPVSKSVAGS